MLLSEKPIKFHFLKLLVLLLVKKHQKQQKHKRRKRREIGQINSKHKLIKKTKHKNGCISIFYTFKKICPKCFTYQNTILPEIVVQGQEKHSSLKLRTKCPTPHHTTPS